MKREYNRKIKKASVHQPRTLLIMSPPKTGKTVITANLTTEFAPGDSQVISIGDEDNYNVVDANYEHFNTLTSFEKYLDDLIKDQPFTFIAYDNLSALDEWCEYYGTLAYMGSSMGKNFNLKARQVNERAVGPRFNTKTYAQYFLKGDPEFMSVYSLAKGSGYLWGRSVSDRIMRKMSQSAKHVIFLGHIKMNDDTKDDSGKVVRSEFLAYTGKAGTKIVQEADVVSSMYRKKGEGYLSFKHGSTDMNAGCRFAYLEGQQVLISNKEEDGTITVNWDLVYPNYKKKD